LAACGSGGHQGPVSGTAPSTTAPSTTAGQSVAATPATGPAATPTTQAPATTPAGEATPAGTTTTPGAAIVAASDATDWATYHGGASRTGATTAGPSGLSAPPVAWTAHVRGAVYAEPVAAGGLVVIATEDDVVTALDAGTGAVRWSQTLGQPVPGSSLPCGDIDPTGITSTPVIDAAAGVVHVVAFLEPIHHELVTLDLATGAIRSRAAIDPPGLDPTVEQQRAGLTMANGRVYVGFGGLFGDCGSYKGAVVSAAVSALDGPGTAGTAETHVPLVTWITTATKEGAIWSVSGPTVTPDGSLYVTTGNGGDAPGEAFDGGDAVVRLSPTLAQTDIFAPTNWLALSEDDQDLGSTSAAIVGGQLVEAGKEGVAYLLDPAHLGGVGGQVASVHACNAAFGGTAVEGDVAYLPCRDGLAAVAVVGSGLKVVWHGPDFDAGGPIVAGGSVWVADLDSGELVALDPATGKKRSLVHVGTLAHFATPGLADGRLVMATMSGTVIAYGS